MDKKVAALFGAAAALTAVTAANAVPSQTNVVPGYRALLDPIPNPTAALKADDARAVAESGNALVQLAQYYHHHHHRYYRRRHHHHHHHHHHHSYYR